MSVFQIVSSTVRQSGDNTGTHEECTYVQYTKMEMGAEQL